MGLICLWVDVRDRGRRGAWVGGDFALTYSFHSSKILVFFFIYSKGGISRATKIRKETFIKKKVATHCSDKSPNEQPKEVNFGGRGVLMPFS